MLTNGQKKLAAVTLALIGLWGTIQASKERTAAPQETTAAVSTESAATEAQSAP